MFQVFEKDPSPSVYDYVLVLEYDIRQKSRFLVQLDSGEEVAVQLPRGKIIRGGEVLRAKSGERILVKAAEETVSTATTSDPLLFSRACYHLGNRHVPLQIEENRVRYQHDHVLDHMLLDLGLQVIKEQASFEPESGAYHRHAH